MYDVLFVNCHRQIERTPNIVGDWLGVFSLATFLDKNGYPSRAFSGYAHEVPNLLERETAKGIKILGLSCDYENRAEVLRISRFAREKYGLTIIIGGPQSIGLSYDFLRESGALAIVHGEGELPLLALAQYVIDGFGDLRQIAGITFMENGRGLSTLRGKPIKHLDNLPFIDPSLALNADFRAKTLTVLTARGCPFRCAFCYEGSATRGARWRSVANVMAEIRNALNEKPSLRYVLFGDDTFTLNAKRLENFIDELGRLREKRDFVWFAEAHPATIVRHPHLVEGMVKAGLANLQIGVESGAPEILKAYNKKTTPEMVEEAVRVCKSAGVPNVVANVIIGGAHETRETLVRSREFALRLLELGAGMFDIRGVYFWPLPNTAMTLNPARFGMEILDPESLTAVTDYPAVRCGDLSRADLVEAHRAFNEAVANKRKELLPALSVSWIKKIMALAWRYPFMSEWTRELIHNERVRKYTRLLNDGAIKNHADVAPEEISNWRPQRTCPPLLIGGQHYAGDLPIHPELFNIFVASTGRMTNAEAAAYCGLELAEFMAGAILLEENMALGFCEF